MPGDILEENETLHRVGPSHSPTSSLPVHQMYEGVQLRLAELGPDQWDFPADSIVYLGSLRKLVVVLNCYAFGWFVT